MRTHDVRDPDGGGREFIIMMVHAGMEERMVAITTSDWMACWSLFLRLLGEGRVDLVIPFHDRFQVVTRSHGEERWAMCCRTGDEWRCFALTDEDVRLYNAAVACATANFYDEDSEDSFGRSVDSIDQRVRAVWENENWRAEFLQAAAR